jgi:phosphate transport system substrate-binding protein
MFSKIRMTATSAMAAVLLAASGGASHAAASHQLIQGSGSSWATNALNVWIAGVTSSGLKVVFTSTGSAIGRKDFANQTTDFAVSDIGYQGKDPLTGDYDLPCKLGQANSCREFAYLPIVSGGTSFPYHIEKAGKLVRNLRLSGETIAKIFTGQITNWGDPQVTRDNNGNKMPSIPIVPVNHAEGSGSTAQFTSWLDNRYPNIWRPFAGGSGETEYYPTRQGMIKQTGSDGVVNFITGDSGNGAIGYDEYSYALAKNYPVAKVENSSGYFTLPTQYNVAVALTQAQINTDKSSPNYLLQKLDSVYVYGAPQTYPLSSYSYMIIPTSATDSRMNTAKRQTLADFLYYSICQGQQQMGPIGYSPLPLNLVKASFEQTAKLKTADPNVDVVNRDVTTCNNPTFVAGNLSRNHLAEIAPIPPSCDKAGQGPCSGGGDSGTGNLSSGGSNPPTSGSNGGTGASASNNSGSGNAAGAGQGASGRVSSSSKSRAPQVVSPEGIVSVNPNGQGGDVPSTSTDLVAYRQVGLNSVLAPLAAIELLLIMVGPPALAFFMRRRRRGGQA